MAQTALRLPIHDQIQRAHMLWGYYGPLFVHEAGGR